MTKALFSLCSRTSGSSFRGRHLLQIGSLNQLGAGQEREPSVQVPGAKLTAVLHGLPGSEGKTEYFKPG